MIVTCPLCGEDVHPDDPECPYCGEQLSGADGAYGLWRDGRTLVMDRDAELPNRCVKTNGPAQHQLKRQLCWNHSFVFLLLLVGIVPYFIFAGFWREKATVFIGLSEEWMAKRRRAIIIGWSVVIVAAGMFIAGAAIGELNPDKAVIGLILSVSAPWLGLAGTLYGVFGSRMVAVKRINDRHIWLKGVCWGILEDLPEW